HLSAPQVVSASPSAVSASPSQSWSTPSQSSCAPGKAWTSLSSQSLPWAPLVELLQPAVALLTTKRAALQKSSLSTSQPSLSPPAQFSSTPLPQRSGRPGLMALLASLQSSPTVAAAG